MRGRFRVGLLVLLGVCMARPAWAQPGIGGRRGRKAPALQSLFHVRNEDNKAQIFIRSRKDWTPPELLAIVQNEPSPWIAGMAVGLYLESQRVDPQAAATILLTFSARPGAFGLAASFGATSGHAAEIAEQLLQMPRAGSAVRPRLLAATMLATYARIVADGPRENNWSKAIGVDPKEVRAKKGKGKANAARSGALVSEKIEDVRTGVAKLLAQRDRDLMEPAILAAAWLRIEEVRREVMAVNDTRAPALQGAKLLYMARTGMRVPEETVRDVLAAVPKVPGQFTVLSPALSHYEVRTSGLCYACEALGELGDQKYLNYLHEALADRDLRVQVEAARAIEKIGSADSIAPLLEKVRDYRTAWPVLVYTLSAVGAIPSEKSIPVLIDRLAQETGRFRLDVTYALASIAGQQHGTTADDWKLWWQNNRDNFKVDPKATEVFRREFRVPDMRVQALGSFYNLHIYSDRVVFVLDTSLSMRGERIDSLKVNLVETLKMLNPIVQFNVVDFGGALALMKAGGLITATEIPAVIQKVARMDLTLGTRTYDAMELAFMLPGVDTIILLSDGAPVSGKFDAWSRIITAVQVYNRYRPIAIYCLEFSASGQNLAWLEEMALRNYGTSASPNP